MFVESSEDSDPVRLAGGEQTQTVADPKWLPLLNIWKATLMLFYFLIVGVSDSQKSDTKPRASLIKCYQDNVSDPKSGSDERRAFYSSRREQFVSLCTWFRTSVGRSCIEGDSQAAANHLTLALIHHHHDRYYYCYKATVPPLKLSTSPDGDQPLV